MADLTLPGTIPGLLRRGSPVIASRIAAAPRDAVYDQHALIVGTDIDSDAVRVALLNDERFLWLAPYEVALNLTDATGRAHAAWWLAASWLGRPPKYGAVLIPDRHWDGGSSWWLHIEGGSALMRMLHDRHGTPADKVIPALADFDPADPRLLEDGSRWADAEALRLVVCHVAGVSP